MFLLNLGHTGGGPQFYLANVSIISTVPGDRGGADKNRDINRDIFDDTKIGTLIVKDDTKENICVIGSGYFGRALAGRLVTVARSVFILYN